VHDVVSRQSPYNALRLAVARLDGQLAALLSQPDVDLSCTLQLGELGEDRLQGLLHAFVRVLLDAAAQESLISSKNRSEADSFCRDRWFWPCKATKRAPGIPAASWRPASMICDLFLPKMNGLEAIKAIRQIHPRMLIITASGFMFGSACPQMPNFDAMAAEVGATSTLY
jgi:CheY-like chemotaxis protein